MLDLNQFMKKTNVSKRKYVDEWFQKNLIPGATCVEGKYSFPDSARRPYRNRHLKAGISADILRAHIVKAALLRQHICVDMCFMSPGEFLGMIKDLERADLITIRTEDDITYYDSTIKSSAYKNKSLKEIGKFVQDCIEAAAKGATKGYLEHVTGSSPANHR